MSAIQEPFSEGASLMHRLDPRGKIVVAALFSILVAVAKSFPGGPGRTGPGPRLAGPGASASGKKCSPSCWR